MFTEKRAVFLYCVSPVHFGAGTALGVIDNPIQRERHTGHPVFAGSGIKGASRHACRHLGWNSPELDAVFGPAPDDAAKVESGEAAEDAKFFAGAVSFTDAQIVALPVRAITRAFVYATSPLALARAQRLLALAGHAPNWTIPALNQGECVANPASRDLLVEGKLALEMFEFAPPANHSEEAEHLSSIGQWLARKAIPGGAEWQFFREHLKSDLVLLSDEDFGYYARHATSVEPHVRINDDSGAADDGGLFYTENLPPESLMISLLLASAERRKAGGLTADEVAQLLVARDGNGAKGLNGRLLQLGGDATTGRGQVMMSVLAPDGAQAPKGDK